MTETEPTEKPSGEGAAQEAAAEERPRHSLPLWLRGIIVLSFAGWTFGTTFLPGLMDLFRIPLAVMVLVSVFGYFRAGMKAPASLPGRRAGAVMWLCLLVILYASGQYKFKRMQSRMEPLFSALEKYKADKGAYPAALGQLEPEYIERVPACGFAPADGPYYFQSRDDRSASGSLGRSQYNIVCQRPVWLGYSRYYYDSQYGYWDKSSNLK